MFELVENRLYDNAVDSTLPAVVRKPADRPEDRQTWLEFMSGAITGA